MPLSPGHHLGPYEIATAIGAGGMGEVYRARDTKLNRDVALKVLPDAFALDPDRLARFKREAQLLASLNHPHIAAIYGFEDSGDVHALVLELVEGPTLADRIAQGSIPIDEAIPIARQIAQALEAAHSQGIVHRDLKPANIKLRPDGTVKVLDFGLAKAVDATADGIRRQSNLSVSPTITSPAMTQLGVILGTAPYMSPEQAKGHAADKRSDVWAFGCVLYEMFTARRAFEGGDVSDTLAAVLRADPDWAALPRDLPASIRALLQGCLTKDRRERIGDVSTLIFLLRQPNGVAVAGPTLEARPRRRWMVALALGVTAVVFAALGVVGGLRIRPSPAAPMTRFSIPLGEGERFGSANRAVAISPDGSRIAYTAEGARDRLAEGSRLLLRSMSSLESRSIGPPAPITSGTIGQPFFSPDGQWIGFYFGPDRTIKKISVNGGAALTLCPFETQPFGATWFGHTIVFADRATGIRRVSDSGGQSEILVRVNPPESALGPQLIDQGRAVLFTLATESGRDRWDKAAVVVQSLQTGRRTVIVRGGADARYVPGYVIYAAGSTLWAVSFDEATLQAVGSPLPVVEGVSRTTTSAVPNGQARFAASNTGTLVYVPGSAAGMGSVNRLLIRVDEKGDEQILPVPPQPYLHPRLSPSGKQLAFAIDDGKDASIWVLDDMSSVTPRRLTFQGRSLFPIWSPDGRSLTFQSDRDGDRGLFRQAADGTPPLERLTRAEPSEAHMPNSWSPDGKTLAFTKSVPGISARVLTVSMDGDRTPKPLPESEGTATSQAAFSPDGKWLAYNGVATPAAPPNIFLQPLPSTGAKYQLSLNVGSGAVWSRDGRNIFYEMGPFAANRLARIEVHTSTTIGAGSPTAIEFRRSLEQVSLYRSFDVSPDGRQFVILAIDERSPAVQVPQVTVVENWFEELRQRMAAK